MSLIFITILMLSCSKDNCTRCEEANSGLIQTFCGSDDQLDTFESTLVATNVEDGIDWSCDRN